MSMYTTASIGGIIERPAMVYEVELQLFLRGGMRQTMYRLTFVKLSVQCVLPQHAAHMSMVAKRHLISRVVQLMLTDPISDLAL